MASLLRRLAAAVMADDKAEEAEAPAPELKPQPVDSALFERLGSSGQDYQTGQWADEYHEDLKDWTDRVARFNELRIGDSVVAAQLARIETPILQAQWTVEPGDKPEPLPSERAAEKAERAKTIEKKLPPPPEKLAAFPDDEEDEPGEEVIPEGDDPEELARQDTEAKLCNLLSANLLGKGPKAYRMRTQWTQYLREALTARVFGVSWFERTYRKVSGVLGDMLVIDGLYWLHPKSIEYVHVTRDGELLGLTQRTQHQWYELGPGGQPIVKSEYSHVFIPVERLVCHVRKREGASFEGIADVRHMYADARHGAFLRKAQRIDAANRAIAIPRVKLGPSATPQTKSDAIRWAQRLTSGAPERRFVVDTDGVETGFVDMATGSPDLAEQLRATAFRVALLNGTEFTLLGSEGSGGSYSAGQVQAQYFNQSIQSIAEWLRADIQMQVVEPLSELNVAGLDMPPTLRVADVTPTDLAPILDAKNKGALTFTEDDEQELRRRLKWRPLTDAELEERKAKKSRMEELAAAAVGAQPAGDGESGPPPPMVKPPAELSALRSGYVPTPHERSFVDLDAMAKAHVDFVRDVVHALGPLRDIAVREAVRKMTVKGSSVTVGRLRQKPIRDALQRAADIIRAFGRAQAQDEIRKQVTMLLGASLAFDPFAPVNSRSRGLKGSVSVANAITEELETVIELDVSQILDAVTKGVQREMLRRLSEEMTEKQAAEEVVRAMLDYSNAPLEKMAREIASRGMNGGRAEATEDAVESLAERGLTVEYVVRSAALDDATCDSCRSLDGTRVEVDSEDYWSLMPPNRCEGFEYCRCMYEPVVTQKEG